MAEHDSDARAVAVQRAVDSIPPLTETQREQIQAILRPATTTRHAST